MKKTIFALLLFTACQTGEQVEKPTILTSEPKKLLPIDLGGAIDLFVWKTRLLDTQNRVLSEQYMHPAIDSVDFYTYDAALGRIKIDSNIPYVWDTIHLPRVQLQDSRANTQHRVAIIELWEDAQHVHRQKVEIPKNYDGISFDITRPEKLKIVKQVDIPPYTKEIGALFKDIQIIERNKNGGAARCRAIYNVSHNIEKLVDSVYFESFNCHDPILPIIISRKYRTAHVELWIESQVWETADYNDDLKRAQIRRSYQVINNINLIVFRLQRLLMRKQLAPESLSSARDKIAQLVETLQTVRVQLKSYIVKFDLEQDPTRVGLGAVIQEYISSIEQAIEILTTENAGNNWQILKRSGIILTFTSLDGISGRIAELAVGKDVAEAEMAWLNDCFPKHIIFQLDAILN